jgi:hypothetical protein
METDPVGPHAAKQPVPAAKSCAGPAHAEDEDEDEDEEDDPDFEIPLHTAITIEHEDEVLDADMSAGYLSGKNRHYTDEDREMLFKLIEEHGSVEAALRVINRIRGFEKVHRSTVRSWRKSTVHKRMGAPVDLAFEDALMDMLIVRATPSTVGGVGDIIANLAYSRQNIETCARLLQKDSRFTSNAVVQRLKFSAGWATRFLKRHDMHRRRVTALDKDLPTPAEVRQHMTGIQERLVASGTTAARTVSADETGIFYGANPLYQYVVPEQVSASAPETDDKARFTALVSATAEGTALPTLLIIKCSKVKGAPYDYTSSRVLHDLWQNEQFNPIKPVHGNPAHREWVEGVWTKQLQLGDAGLRTYKRPYLYNGATNEVITVQHKAWNDSVGTALWVDLVLGPAAQRLGGPLFLIWDNCGPHTVPALAEIFAQHGILVAQLPPRMTHLLQVMDLAVNGPLKAAIRRRRCEQLLQYTHDWRAKRAIEEAKPVDQRQLLPYRAPKPSQVQGLSTILNVIHNLGADDGFRAGVKRAFIEACQAPDPNRRVNGHTGVQLYRPYPVSHSVMKKLHADNVGIEAACDSLADVLAGLSFSQPNPEDSARMDTED